MRSALVSQFSVTENSAGKGHTASRESEKHTILGRSEDTCDVFSFEEWLTNINKNNADKNLERDST